MLDKLRRVLPFTLALPGLVLAVEDCGEPGTITIKQGKDQLVQAPTRVFPDGSIAVRAPLAVNPDGGASSYTLEDHGFTYIANGVSRWKEGEKNVSCEGDKSCRSDFRDAEKNGFGPSTKTFCAFGFAVDPYLAQGSTTSCGKGGAVVGGGRGKPRLGDVVDGATGNRIQTYLSTTTLQHKVGKEYRYLDSESLPLAVTPIPSLLGKVVWVGGDGYQPTFALIADYGNAFGEGSIALHQLLRYNALKAQKPGPIPLEKRCGKEELSLAAPYGSYPMPGDSCKKKGPPEFETDIRAYIGMSGMMDYVVLGSSAFTVENHRIKTTIDRKSIDAAAAGYPAAKIAHMLSCLNR